MAPGKNIPVGKNIAERRPDFYDPVTTGRAIEVKNYGGGQPRPSRSLRSQIDRDAILRDTPNSNYKPEWHFTNMPPTQKLMDLLEANGIPYVIYGK